MKKLLLNINLQTEYLLWFAIWFTLPLSIRLNSLAILIASCVFIYRSVRTGINFRKEYLIIIIPMIAFFFIHLIGVSSSLLELLTWKEIEQMLPLIVFPVLILLSKPKKSVSSQIMLTGLFSALLTGGLIMLTESMYEYSVTKDASVFLYHNLAKPVHSGAIYYSFFIVVLLLQINELSWLTDFPVFRLVSLGFLILLLLLLSSKLMIFGGLVLVILKHRKYLLKSIPHTKYTIPLLVIVLGILLVPGVQRFKEITNPKLNIVMDSGYTYDSPLNGLNLRLIQARFGLELMQENNAWFTGLGIDKAQEKLNNKYYEYGIYTGYEDTDDTGYLNYNFHNQFIETLVRSGVFGLILLLVMLLLLFIYSGKYILVSVWVVLLITMFFLTESVLERQVGIVYFCIVCSSYFPTKEQVNQ